jgi:hypothetical protein
MSVCWKQQHNFHVELGDSRSHGWFLYRRLKNVKLKIFYQLILFSVNWEKTAIVQFQWQNSLGQPMEHHCYPGAYFGNCGFVIISVITRFLWNCTMSYFHIICKFAHFYHHNTAFQDPTSDSNAITGSSKVFTVAMSGMLVRFTNVTLLLPPAVWPFFWLTLKCVSLFRS